MLRSFVDAPPGSQPDLNHVLPLASPEGSSTRTYSAAVVGLGAYRRYVLGTCRSSGPGRLAGGAEKCLCRKEVLGAELLALGASVGSVKHKVRAQGGWDLGFAVL